MEPTKDEIDELYCEEVRWAREMSPGDKLLAGPKLFDRVWRVMLDGIRDQYPAADEAQQMQTLRERLELARRLEVRP